MLLLLKLQTHALLPDGLHHICHPQQPTVASSSVRIRLTKETVTSGQVRVKASASDVIAIRTI